MSKTIYLVFKQCLFQNAGTPWLHLVFEPGREEQAKQYCEENNKMEKESGYPSWNVYYYEKINMINTDGESEE